MIIDTHFHWPMEKDDNLDEILGTLDRQRIDRAVLSGWEVLFKIGQASHWNDRLAKFCDKSRGRLLPLATVHLAEGKTSVNEAKRCLEQLGMGGFKVHPWAQGENMFCNPMYEICELAAGHKVPLMFHDGTPTFSLPSQIGHLASLFPQTTFILGHGGLLHYWREAMEVAIEYPNLYITLCGPNPYGMQIICDRVDIDRILWATDCLGPGYDDLLSYRCGLMNLLKLSDVQRTAIMAGNASRIWKFT
jgi:predicted TIM-barrel fold metal-dependent hydrolase